MSDVAASMPTLAGTKHPRPPNSPDEFEEIAASALRLLLRLPGLSRYGKSGQQQHGVDLFEVTDDARVVGVQLKNEKKTKFSTVEAEVARAETFMPPLTEYYVAVATERDSELQTAAASLALARAKAGKFRVKVIFWDELMQALASDEKEYFKHFPHLRPAVIETERYCGMTFEEMQSVLKQTPIKDSRSKNTQSESALAAMVRCKDLLLDGSMLSDIIGASGLLDYAGRVVAPTLQQFGLTERFSTASGMMAHVLAPHYQLTNDGRRFLLRLLKEKR